MYIHVCKQYLLTNVLCLYFEDINCQLWFLINNFVRLNYIQSNFYYFSQYL